MRVKTASLIVAFAAGTLCLGWSLGNASPKPDVPKATESKPADDDQIAITDKLMERIAIERHDKIPFKDFIEFFSAKLDISIIVDYDTFLSPNPGEAKVEAAELNEKPISLPALKKIRAETVLQLTLKQIGATFLIQPDHIKIVSLEAAREIVQLRVPTVEDDTQSPFSAPTATFLPTKLVSVQLVEKPLPEALKELERRSGITIALAPQAADKVKTTITTQFINVPVERAVATLAEMAGLKLAKKGNVLLVTTAERAKDFADAPSAQPFNPNGFGWQWPGLTFGPTTEEAAKIIAKYGIDWWKGIEKEGAETEKLKKQVAELEKQLGELKKK